MKRFLWFLMVMILSAATLFGCTTVNTTSEANKMTDSAKTNPGTEQPLTQSADSATDNVSSSSTEQQAAAVKDVADDEEYIIKLSDDEDTQAKQAEKEHLNIHVLSLTENAIQISIDDITPAELAKLSYTLEGADTAPQISLFGNEIHIQGLTAAMPYALKIAGNERTGEVDFKTFSPDLDNELRYFIDLYNYRSGLVNITIIGENPRHETITFVNRNDNFAFYNVTDDHHLDTYTENTMTIDRKYDFFRTTYQRKMDLAAKEEIGGFTGLLTPVWFMSDFEDLIVEPDGYAPKNLVAVTVLLPSEEWSNQVGLTETPYNHLFTTDNMELINREGIYAYRTDRFRYATQMIGRIEVRVVTQKTVPKENADMLFDIFKRLGSLWGGYPDLDYYVFFSPQCNNISLTAGEFTHSSAYNYDNTTIFDASSFIHANYHIWNAFGNGLDLDDSNFPFWVEGFTCYYQGLLTEEFMNTETSNGLKENYERVLQAEKEGLDTSMFSDSFTKFEWAYVKGPVMAYLLDQEIYARSNGQHRLSDALKIVWRQAEEANDLSITYSDIISATNTLIDEPINTWWKTYLVNNTPLPEDEQIDFKPIGE